MSNNPNPVPTSVNLFPQQLIDVIANIPPTTNAPAFADLVGEFFRAFELEFFNQNFWKKFAENFVERWNPQVLPTC